MKTKREEQTMTVRRACRWFFKNLCARKTQGKKLEQQGF
jgi:hypothetical protein